MKKLAKNNEKILFYDIIVTFIHMCGRVYMFLNHGIKCISYYGSWLKRKEIEILALPNDDLEQKYLKDYFGDKIFFNGGENL